MCPIETPEGPNIGLISYLATFAKINEYGFIEAPYRKVDKATGVVTDEVVYMTADVEDEFIVAQANEPLDERGPLCPSTCFNARWRDEILEVDRERVDYMDVIAEDGCVRGHGYDPLPGKRRRKPRPHGLEHAASGGAAARQTEQPIVGTGMEYKAACRLRRVRAGQTRRRGRSASTADKITGAHVRDDDGRIRAHQVHALEPGHLHQPAPHRQQGR